MSRVIDAYSRLEHERAERVGASGAPLSDADR